MQSLTDILATALTRPLKSVSTWLLSHDRKFETWVYESAVVATVLIVVTLPTTDWSDWRPIVGNLAGAFGVYFAFSHASVSRHLAEAQASMPLPSVECWPKAESYWVRKEIFWVIAFIASGLYSALVGSVLFLIYPAWRKIHVANRAVVRAAPVKPSV